MEELDEQSQQRRETFALYGLAMYHAQCVEKSLAIMVSSVFNKDFVDANNPIEREVIQDAVFSKTIGQLITRLRKQVSVPSNLNGKLSEAREKRNWLAHEYFWARSGEIMTIRGREKMICELTEISEWFSNVDACLTAIYEKLLIKAGISREMLDEGFRELTDRNK
jgi:hypothetical protein